MDYSTDSIDYQVLKSRLENDSLLMVLTVLDIASFMYTLLKNNGNDFRKMIAVTGCDTREKIKLFRDFFKVFECDGEDTLSLNLKQNELRNILFSRKDEAVIFEDDASTKNRLAENVRLLYDACVRRKKFDNEIAECNCMILCSQAQTMAVLEEYADSILWIDVSEMRFYSDMIALKQRIRNTIIQLAKSDKVLSMLFDVSEYHAQFENDLMSFQHKTKIFIFLTTNGTCIYGEIQEWLRERKDYLICGLSYDGTDMVQDMNRSNSSRLIDLDFFLETYPQQGLKATISAESLPHLYDSMRYLHDKGFRLSCNLAYNIDWSNPTLSGILERELCKLIEYYISNPQIEPCTILNQEIDGLALFDMEHPIRRSYCGAGINMKAYDLNGEAYPCQFFLPLSIGKEKSVASRSLHFYHDTIPEELIEEKCRKCVVQSLCPNCFGANYASTGDIRSINSQKNMKAVSLKMLLYKENQI